MTADRDRLCNCTIVNRSVSDGFPPSSGVSCSTPWALVDLGVVKNDDVAGIGNETDPHQHKTRTSILRTQVVLRHAESSQLLLAQRERVGLSSRIWARR